MKKVVGVACVYLSYKQYLRGWEVSQDLNKPKLEIAWLKVGYMGAKDEDPMVVMRGNEKSHIIRI